MWGIGRGSGSGFLVLLFVLTITFSLISAGILKANTTVGIDAYAKKSKKPSEENSNDGGGNGGKSGDSGDGGSESKDKKNNDQGTNDKPTVPLVDTTTPPPPPPPPTTCEKDPTSRECTKDKQQLSGQPDCSTNPDDTACKSLRENTECKANPDDAACKPTEQVPGVDCTTNPNDASCKTTQEQKVDCSINPNDPSCSQQPPPADCSTIPDDPSCTPSPPTVDCKANPDNPSCTTPQLTDCDKNPDDPSCKVDCSKNPDDILCKVDCTTNPDDPSCPPPTTCPEGSIPTADGKCEKKPHPDDDCLFDPSLSKCKATCDENNFCKCPEGFSMNEDDHCFPNKSCPKGYERHNEDETGKCFPISCPSGQHFDPNVNKCVPICPDGTKILDGKCPTKVLSLSISVDKDPIIRGHEQTITVTVSDKDTHQKISGANVKIAVVYTTGFQHSCSGSTDGSGRAVCKWTIGGNANPGTFKVTATATKDGYKSASGSASFKVISAPPPRRGGGGGGGDHNQVATAAAIQQIKYFREFTDMPANSPLFITSTSMHKDILNDIIITGEIKNRGTSTANFVELIATFYNINNQTIGNENTFTKPSTVQSGQAAPFTMYLNPKDMPLSQIKSVKYHLSWKYTSGSSTLSLTSPSPAGKTPQPNR